MLLESIGLAIITIMLLAFYIPLGGIFLLGLIIWKLYRKVKPKSKNDWGNW